MAQMAIYQYKPLNVHFIGHISVSVLNSAEPNQTPQNVASDQVPHCLLTESSFKNLN